MRRSPHVLLAEDEDLVAMVVAEVLESEGFRVTDMRMPVMDGEALIRIIRQRRPDLPVVVTTGFSEHIPNEEPGRLVVLREPCSLSMLAPGITALRSGRTAPTS